MKGHSYIALLCSLSPGRCAGQIDHKDRRCAGGGEVLDVITHFGLRHAESVVLRDVPIMGRVLGASETDASRYAAASLVGFRPRHDTERDLSGPQRGNSGGAAD